MKNFILFSTSYSWFSLYIFNHQNLSLNFIYIEFTNRESSWEILSPLSPFQFPAHYVIQDGPETDRIPSQVVWNIPPLPHHLLPSTVFPSDREFFYPPSLLSLSFFTWFFFHFPACTASQFKCRNEQCVDSSARCNGVNDCSDHSDELNCREYQKILSLSIIDLLLAITIILDNYFLDPFNSLGLVKFGIWCLAIDLLGCYVIDMSA